MTDNTRKFNRYVLPAILYLAVIFTVSSIPTVRPPHLGISWEDKIYHFVEYAGLAIVIFRALLYWDWSGPFFRRGMLSVAICSSIGAIDEIHQLFISGRTTEFGDWFSDTIGAVLGVILVFLAYALFKPEGLRKGS